MKLRKVLLAATAVMMIAGAYAQREKRGDICKEIPNLNSEQKQTLCNHLREISFVKKPQIFNGRKWGSGNL